MRTWAEISLDNLAHNYRTLRAMLPQGCKFLGLVKSNAYGHGAVMVARKLQSLGCDMLAVACVDEAAELRQGGVTLPILCLGQTPVELAPLLLEYQVTQTVADLETGLALSAAAVAAGKELTIHVKLDTGMTRLGFLWQEGLENQTADQIARLCALPGLRAEGMFTHFADADGSEEYTMLQFTRFLDAKQALVDRGVTFKICHCAASAAVLNYPCTYLDMVRPGIVLYGHYPDPSLEGLDGPGLLPVMTLKSRVAAVRSVPAGTFVSYGRTAKLERDTRLAVLPIGYGDGYSRQFSNRMEVLLHGQRCPVVGRVCMDMCMVDVTDLPQVKAGDVAVLYGQDGLLEQGAAIANTIPYELLCNVSPRVHRVYLDQEK
jgi:alanine racemase